MFQLSETFALKFQRFFWLKDFPVFLTVDYDQGEMFQMRLLKIPLVEICFMKYSVSQNPKNALDRDASKIQK